MDLQIPEIKTLAKILIINQFRLIESFKLYSKISGRHYIEFFVIVIYFYLLNVYV